MRLLQGLDRLETGLPAALARRRWWLVGAVLVLYLAITCTLARQKLFWNDELFTLYISRLPRLVDIWSILDTGVEQLPPTFHILTRTFMWLFGENHLAVRLPEILGMGLMSLCLFFVVAHRASTTYGVVAMILPLVTQAYYYAYEARPYGLVLGFSAASLFCWQSAAEGRRRILSLVGLTAALTAALATHYYSVLLFVPLAAGELARSIMRKRVDLRIWLAFFIATIPLWIFLPLIQAGRRHTSTFWAKPRWHDVVGFYHNLFSSGPFPLLAILLLLALYAIIRPYRGERDHTASARVPVHEVVAAVGYLAIPAVAVLLAKLVTGAFTDRYAITGVVGLALIIPWGAYHILDRRETMGALLAVILCSWFVVTDGIKLAAKLRQDRADHHETYDFFRASAPIGLPLAIASPHVFFQLSHYAPPDFASRFVYLADSAASLRHLQTDTPEIGIQEFRRWTPMLIEDYRPYVGAHPRFLLYGDMSRWAWLLSELVAKGARIELVALDGAIPLYLVDLVPVSTSRARIGTSK